jgi:iron complex outermembrane receptor protein
VNYSDEFALVLDLDPNAYQDEFAKVDARLTIRNATRSWELSLIGRNLTDELTRGFSNDGLGGPFMAGSYFSMVDAPRSIALQGLVRF